MRYIEINGRKYYVSDEVFFAMRKFVRREKYLTERDRDNGSVSYEALEAVVSADITVETEFDINERSNRLWAALRSLDERDFDFITRFYFELADTDELAEEFNISRKKVYYNRDRILKKLRRLLEDMND